MANWATAPAKTGAPSRWFGETMHNIKANHVMAVLATLLLVACGDGGSSSNNSRPGGTSQEPVCPECLPSSCSDKPGEAGGVLSCGNSCPPGYACSEQNICQGGNAQQLLLDVKAVPFSGWVTLNGRNPESKHSACAETDTAPNPAPRGHVVLTDTHNPETVFTLVLKGCNPSDKATFSGFVFPGTYRVVVRGAHSDLPTADFGVDAAFVISSAQSNVVFDVKAVSISGHVTLNSANPNGGGGPCKEEEGNAFPRGRVVLTDIHNAAAVFTLDLKDCELSRLATFSGFVFPGTYRVVIRGAHSDLPKADFVASTAFVISSAQTNLLWDVKTIRIAGEVTLNSTNPDGRGGSCKEEEDNAFPRGRVVLTDVHNAAAVFTLDLKDCEPSSPATFSGTVFPGTYRVVVHGAHSNLPGSTFVAAPALRVP